MTAPELHSKLINYHIDFSTLKNCTTEVILSVYTDLSSDSLEAEEKCEKVGNHNLNHLYTELKFRGQDVNRLVVY